MNKFQKWLADFGGAEVLASRLGVTCHVVNRWRRGEGWPRIAIILKIVKLSRGALTTDDVIKYTYLAKRRGRHA
jgi:transcriptional regulator with XRE-family HTH domain